MFLGRGREGVRVAVELRLRAAGRDGTWERAESAEREPARHALAVPLECSVEGHTATLHWENGFPLIAAGM